jgi:Tol biopolymer transport system component
MPASDPIAQLNQALAGRYLVERTLGAGGMATVYLAQDLKHDRKVALKLLRPELAAVLGAERFVQEIKTTASLQHPHILPLFDSGVASTEAESPSRPAAEYLFYVMPYIQGETLREKLRRETQLGVDEAVRIAREVADALDYAHRHGVIHRDIKPENILLHDGRPMVADFGIALAVSVAADGRLTETGLSLGTPYYMSPEQATAAKEITARSDVYSLGSVLYEMLTGNPPHTGASAQQIIMKIVTEDAAPIAKLRKSVPPNVVAAVAKSLEKLPADRFDSAKAFADALADTSFTTARIAGRDAREMPGRREVSPRLFAATAAVAAVALVGWAWNALRPTARSVQRARFTLAFGDSARLRTDQYGVSLALSPDGSQLAWIGGSSRGIYLRGLNDLAPRALEGADNAMNPQFSPDGKWLAYVLDNRLKRLPLSGGPRVTIAENVANYSWGDGDVVVFAGVLAGINAGLWRVSAAGGQPQRLTRPDSARREVAHYWPQLLPGGKAVLFEIRYGTSETDSLAVLRLADGRVTALDIQGSNPRFIPTGHLLFGRPDGSVTAVRFDPRSLRVTGPQVPVLENVPITPGAALGQGGGIAFALAGNGTLVYAQQGAEAQLVLVDRQGRIRSLRPDRGAYSDPRFSPDGKRLALAIVGAGGGPDIWIQDNAAGTLTRLTNDGRSDRPSWTPDGRRVAWRAKGDSSAFDIKWAPSDGSGVTDTLFRDGWSAAFAPSGKAVFTNTVRPVTASDIDVVSLDPTRHRSTLVNTTGSEVAQRVSPDGQWLAFASTQSGRYEVFVRAVDGPAGQHQISTNGGQEPVWSPHGRELFFRVGTKLIAATIATSPNFAVVRRDTLFDEVFRMGGNSAGYDVSPDGQTFVMVKAVGGEAPPVIVLGWLDELRERMELATKQ